MQGLLATPDEVMLDYMMSGDGVPRRPLAGMLGPFLPFTVPVEGKGLRVAVPPILSDIQDAVMAPLQAYRGELDDPVSSAQNLAGMVTGGGLLAGTPTRQAAAESRQAMLGAGGGKLTRKDIDPLFFGKVTADTPLDQMNIDLEPIDLLGQRMVVKPEDIQNTVLLFGAGDRTGTGLLKAVDDVVFDEPVEMLGGRNFQLATPDAWASGKSVVTNLLNRAKQAQEETGIDRVLLAHSTMGRPAVDFSEMGSSALAEMIKASKITKKSAKEFDKEYKEFLLGKAKVAEGKGSQAKADQLRKLAKDYVGVLSPDLRQFLAKLPAGSLRDAFAKQMDTKKYKDMGFPAPSKTRFALTEPAQIEIPTFQTGMSFQPIDVARGAIVDPVMPHASYSHAIGKLNNEMPVQFERPISTHDVYRDFERQLELEGKTVSASGKPLQSSAIQPSYRSTIPYQVVDQELVDRMSLLLGE
tara:strand:+ start:2223 stop:3626 length:1404 start_codon:yes stop_codon:yes gene_type:complete